MSNLELDEQFKGKSYSEILDELRDLKRKTATVYVPALCVAYKKEHLTMENEEIKERVMDDCLEIGLWSESHIRGCFPKWVNRAYPLNTKRFKETLNSPKEVALQQKLDLLSKTIKQLPEPPREQEGEDDDPVEYYGSTLSESKEKEKPTPEYLYGEVIDGIGQAWCALANTDHIPGVNEDVLVEYLKPSDKHRLHMFKGLDYPRAAYCINVLTWMDMTIQRTLRMWQDIQKEPDNKREIQR